METETTITQTKNYKLGKFLAGHNAIKFHFCSSVETNQIYAAKVIQKASLEKPKSHEKIQNEVNIQRDLKHPYIISLEEHFNDEQNIYILYEYCQKNNLKNYILRYKRMKEELAKIVIWNIIQAVKYLHSQNILHRDIKIGNILLTAENQAKLGNFVSSVKLENSEEKVKDISGTSNYMAPEILQNENGYSFSVDVWSIGVVLYYLVCGYSPFKSDDVKETYRKVREEEFEFPEGIDMTDKFKDLVSGILVADPEKRLTLEHVENHEFFKGVTEKIPKGWIKDPSVGPGIQMKFQSGKNIE